MGRKRLVTTVMSCLDSLKSSLHTPDIDVSADFLEGALGQDLTFPLEREVALGQPTNKLNFIPSGTPPPPPQTMLGYMFPCGSGEAGFATASVNKNFLLQTAGRPFRESQIPLR